MILFRVKERQKPHKGVENSAYYAPLGCKVSVFFSGNQQFKGFYYSKKCIFVVVESTSKRNLISTLHFPTQRRAFHPCSNQKLSLHLQQNRSQLSDMNSTILTSTSTPLPQNSPSRIDALDFLKCIFVLLMVAFHLAYFADAHPLLKQWVYTFHMPGFLLISGYLMRVDRPLRQFSRTLLWLAVPYLVLESSYIVASAFLPVRDGVAQLSLSVFAEKFFLHPLGPYWYLHTLILCGVSYYAVWLFRQCNLLTHFIWLAFTLGALAALQLVAWDVSLYFFLGVVIRQSRLTFSDVFRPSLWAFVGLAILGFFPDTFHKGTIGGVFTVYLVIAASLALLPHLPTWLRRSTLFLGRNSLALFLFSPIFTMGCKVFIPYLSFDSSRCLFLLISLPLCVIGALVVCRLLDALHLSPFLFGRQRALQ